MKRLSLAAHLALLATLMAIPTTTPAIADDWVVVSASGGSWAWTQTGFYQGSKRQLIGGRVAGNLGLPAHFHLVGRCDVSALQDGGDVAFEISDPNTFQSVECYAGAYRPFVGGLGLTAIYGLGADIEGGGIKPMERYPSTYGAGLRVGNATGGLWAYVLFGKHEASGPGFKVIVTAQVPLRGRTSFVADGVFGKGSFYRGGIAVRLH